MKDKEVGSLLFLTDTSYSRIMGHLQRNRIEKEALEREMIYKKHLKQESDKMAKKWPDSVQNIKNREQERRIMKEQQIEEMRNAQSEYYKEFHRQEREKFIAEIRDKMKMKKQPNSALSNALLESQIKAENLANLKLRREIQLDEDKKEEAWVELVHKTVGEFKRNEEEEKCKAREKSKLVQAFQLKQIEEKLNKELQGKMNRLKEEQEDLKRLGDEIKQRKDIEVEDFKNRKIEVKKYLSSETQKKEREKNILKTEEAELQEVCGIYNDSYKNRCCRIRKQRNREIEDIIEARLKLGLSNKKAEENKEEKQNQIILKQQLEEEKRYQQNEEQSTKHKNEMQYEMDGFFKDIKMKNQKREEERAEIFRSKVAERFKNTEQTEKYDEKRMKQIKESGIVFSKEWDKQIKEKEEINKNIVPEKLEKYYHEIEDANFFSYAKEVLDYARSKGMDDYSIRREINKYCRKNQLNIPEFPEGSSTSSTSKPTRSEVKLPKI